jgi:hypothetical protein
LTVLSNAPSSQSHWYQTERNTEALVKAVVAIRRVNALSAEDIWCLIRLTWVTAGSAESHWQQLKAPALAHLFKKPVDLTEDLASTLAGMGLPSAVASAASKQTGMVNAYRAYRNSLLDWCNGNKAVLRSILWSAQTLGSNNQARFDLARRIDELPRVPTPNGARHMAAANLITPLIACLDPKLRFPIVNGESGVKRRLAKLNLSNGSLEEKVRGLTGIIGQFGIIDAFALDVMSDEQIDKIKKRTPKPPKAGAAQSSGNMELLHDLQITALWFADADCETLSGEGKAMGGAGDEAACMSASRLASLGPSGVVFYWLGTNLEGLICSIPLLKPHCRSIPPIRRSAMYTTEMLTCSTSSKER